MDYKVTVEFEDPYDDSDDCVMKTRSGTVVDADNADDAENKFIDALEWDYGTSDLAVHTAHATEI